MTDEEKAEEYYEDNECYSYLSEVEDFEEVFGFVKDRVKQAYLDGLTEGRKEKCLEQNNDGTIRPCEVMKENAELKGQVKLLSEKVGFWEGQTKAKEAQIEEYDRLAMFDISRTDELKAQIEQLSNDNHILKTSFITQQEQIKKMKCCYNCKYGQICFTNEIIEDYLANKVNPNNKCENCDKWELVE